MSDPQRQSSTHSPRVDDELAHEVASLDHGAPLESRSRPDRLQEDTGFEGGDAPVGVHGAAPAGMTPDEVDLRSEVAQALRPHEFPARRERLVEMAQEANAPDRVVEELQWLPDRQFDNVEQVWEALGHRGEARRA